MPKYRLFHRYLSQVVWVANEQSHNFEICNELLQRCWDLAFRVELISASIVDFQWHKFFDFLYQTESWLESKFCLSLSATARAVCKSTVLGCCIFALIVVVVALVVVLLVSLPADSLVIDTFTFVWTWSHGLMMAFLQCLQFFSLIHWLSLWPFRRQLKYRLLFARTFFRLSQLNTLSQEAE